MSQKPYIFERAEGITYVREFGQTERVVYSMDPELRQYLDDMKEEALWKEIFAEAKTNKALQEALDRVKIIYHLGKEDGTE